MDKWREMGEMGFLGPTAPAEYGGLGMGYYEHCIINEEISRCPSDLSANRSTSLTESERALALVSAMVHTVRLAIP